MSIRGALARRFDDRPMGPGLKWRRTMRVMVFSKLCEEPKMDGPPSPEMLEAFAAMDAFTEELIKAGVFVAAAGLKAGPEAKRILFGGPKRTITDGPFAESRELVAGFSIWEVKDMDEALAWARRAPDGAPGMKGAMEIFPFYEAEDLAAFMSPEELAAPREGERGKLGVA
jgi:hypothetical protein